MKQTETQEAKMQETTYTQDDGFNGYYEGTGERWSMLRAYDGLGNQIATGFHVTLKEAREIAEENGAPLMIFEPSKGASWYGYFDPIKMSYRKTTNRDMFDWMYWYKRAYATGKVK